MLLLVTMLTLTVLTASTQHVPVGTSPEMWPPVRVLWGPDPCLPRGPLAHFNSTQLEVLSRVIVDNGHEVIAQVALLVTAVLVHVLRGHQGGNVKDSCEAEWGQAEWAQHSQAGCCQGLVGPEWV